MMMKIMSRETHHYIESYGGYNWDIEIVDYGKIFEAWLSISSIGIKTLMFGWIKDQSHSKVDPKIWTLSDFQDLIDANFEEYADEYLEKYNPEEDIPF